MTAKSSKDTVKTPKGLFNRDKASHPASGIPLDKEAIKPLLIKYRGNLTRCAVALGCSRNSIKRLIDQHPDLKEVHEESRERVIDEVEDAFTNRALKGDTTSAIFFLKTRARERGYDQDFRADIEAVTRSALEFALNKSKNPAE